MEIQNRALKVQGGISAGGKVAASPGAPVPRNEEHRTFTQKMGDFISVNRVILLIALSIVLAGVVTLAIWSMVIGALVEKSTTRIEALAVDFGSWSSEQDAAKKTDLEKTLLIGLDEVAARWPNLFAAQRALAMRARVAEERKDWASAEKDWAAIASGFPKAYLAPIALQNAAVAAEERGAPTDAVKYLEAFIKDYEGTSPGVAHAYFSLGRMAEGAGDWTAAVGDYEKLVTTWPDSDWTKLARDRIIKIKSQGLVK